MRRLGRLLLVLVLLTVAGTAGGAWWARGQLRGSLPQIDGERRLEGLGAQVEITRDALGIPTIRGATRLDVARATGFAHGQDRFFQMDLARRRAAGELAALVGPAALPVDRDIRLHRFRAQAVRTLASMSDTDRRMLDVYAAGANAALAGLAVPPFEYRVLRQTPEPWRPEDSLLVVLAMFITLQDSDGEYEATLATMHDTLPQPVFDFLAPRGTDWDTPIVGDAFALSPIPGVDVYDLRSRRRGRDTRPIVLPDVGAQTRVDQTAPWAPERSEAIGSNSFAVSGALTADGRALVANDMHLGIRVPNTWYRASLEWPHPASPSEPNRLIGLTLPGVPALVTGSNTRVAWGFTNTYADFSDIVLLEIDPQDPTRYRTPSGWRAFERHREVIRVAGEPDVVEDVRWTIWGPVMPPDHLGRARAYRWVAHDAERLASSITPLERAATIEEAVAEANGLGTPGQNFVVADRSGRIGWSVYGVMPRRMGMDGQLPSSWADGSRGWNGWLDDAEFPRVLDPADGRLWTANARVVGGDMLALLGDGSYEIGSRARVIRRRLDERARFDARDLLAIQLDVSADFMVRWRDIVLRTLTAEAVAGRPGRAAFRRVVETQWSGQADADSAAYRLTRAFRETVSGRVAAFVLADCYEADPTFDYTAVRRRDGPIWTIVHERPLHLLDPRYASWDEMLLAAVDDTVDALIRDDGTDDLAAMRWSDMNRTAYRHPLSAALPFIGRWLDMPRAAIPGDLYTPRVSWRGIAASVRMVVSPGREAEGILEMPTGQSGHPLSPFYANSHGPWLRGEPTPFLPGPAVHALTLTP